jgi:hypothetical protein
MLQVTKRLYWQLLLDHVNYETPIVLTFSAKITPLVSGVEHSNEIAAGEYQYYSLNSQAGSTYKVKIIIQIES